MSFLINLLKIQQAEQKDRLFAKGTYHTQQCVKFSLGLTLILLTNK